MSMTSTPCIAALRAAASRSGRSQVTKHQQLRRFHGLSPTRLHARKQASPIHLIQQYSFASSSTTPASPGPSPSSSSSSRTTGYSSYVHSILSGILVAYAVDVWRNRGEQQEDEYDGKLLSLPTAKADEKKHHSLPSHASLDETPIHLDPDTSIPFPASIKPIGTSSSQELKLIGLGVRTVSFLRVKVYSAGAYFDPSALAAIRNNESKGEALIAHILDQPHDVAIRIVPTRNTDHSHLRDGFVRAMLARMKQATSSKSLSEAEAEAAGKQLDNFKGFFPTGKVAKGKYMLITRRGTDGALLLEYEGKLLGTMENAFLSKQLLLAYFADNDKEISPKLKSDVLAGLERFM